MARVVLESKKPVYRRQTRNRDPITRRERIGEGRKRADDERRARVDHDHSALPQHHHAPRLEVTRTEHRKLAPGFFDFFDLFGS